MNELISIIHNELNKVNINHTHNNLYYTKDEIDNKLNNKSNTNHTHSNFVKSGSGAKAGLVPAPSTTAGTTKYLREDCTWSTPTPSDIGAVSTSKILTTKDQVNTNTDVSNVAGATAVKDMISELSDSFGANWLPYNGYDILGKW